MKTLTKCEFTNIYFRKLTEIYPAVDFKILSDLIIIGVYQETEYKHFLDNAFLEYKENSEAIESILDKYINSSLEIYNKKETQINRIIPIIKPVEFLDGLKELIIKKAPDSWVVYEHYNEELIVVYAEDTEKSIYYLTHEELDKLEINKKDLLAFAIDNLRSLLPDLRRFGQNGVYGLAAGGDFEASLILLPEIWGKENFQVEGAFVIAIPNRDMLLITGSRNENGIEKIKEIALECYKTGNYQVSPHLFKYNGNKFIKY